MRLILPVSFIIFFSIPAFAQPPVKWQKVYGGVNNESATVIHQTLDSGYIMIGSSDANGGQVTGHHGGNFNDMWVVKTDTAGVLQWQKSFGGTATDYGTAIIQLPDSGYILCGSVNSSDGDVSGNFGQTDYWVARLNSTGTIVWENSYGGSGTDDPNDIQQTSDGGFIIVGSSSSNDTDVTGNHGGTDCWVAKIDSAGNLQWQKSLGGSGNDAGNSVRQTSDGGYIIGASTASNNGNVSGNHGQNDFWIVKITSTGSIDWKKCYGGSNHEFATGIIITGDSGYVMVGRSYSTNGDVNGHHGTTSWEDCWVIAVDTVGTLKWEISFGGTSFDFGYSVEQLADSGFIVAGYTASTDGDITGALGSADFYLLRLTTTGSIQWLKLFGGTGYDAAKYACSTNDGYYIIAGGTTSTDGDVTFHNGPVSITNNDFWVVKMGILDTTTTNGVGIAENSKEQINLYPNPASSVVRFDNAQGKFSSVRITDISGQIVYEVPVNKNGVIEIDVAGLAEGIYFVTGLGTEAVETSKLCIRH
jgi:hypothetical protein